MISRIKGTLVSREADGIEVETAGGVVYEIEVPLSILERIPPPPSKGFVIRTLYIVREDSATLYGFLETRDRELFRRLLGASGVGPKVALAMMSTYSGARLARALAERDIPALTRVSGVGKKTAERIVVELSDKVQDLALLGTATPAAERDETVQAAVSALVALGFSFAEAEKLVKKALDAGPGSSTEELVRRALGGEP